MSYYIFKNTELIGVETKKDKVDEIVLNNLKAEGFKNEFSGQFGFSKYWVLESDSFMVCASANGEVLTGWRDCVC